MLPKISPPPLSPFDMNQQRSACDRCRGQKLRCTRGHQAKEYEPCTRCLKIGVQCTTSCSRPLGRPRTTEAAKRRAKPIKTRTTPPEVLSLDPTSTHLPATIEKFQAPSDLWNSACSDSYPSTLPDLSSEIWFDSMNPAVDLAFDTSVGCEFDMQLPSTDDFLDLGPFLESPLRLQNDVVQPAVPHQNHRQKSSAKLLESTDTLATLSRLNEDLARQICRIDSYAWGPADTPQDCVTERQELKAHPMAEILQSTSQFVAIIENLKSVLLPPKPSLDRSGFRLSSVAASESRMFDSPPEESSALSLAMPQPSFQELLPLSTPLAMTILSSYLLLLEFYDLIFSRVHDSLSAIEDTSVFFQGMPEIRVDGLSSMKGHIYVKIIFQVIEHHFDRISGLLGLPMEFSLSEQPQNFEGLLATKDLSQLVHAAMMQMERSSGPSTIPTLKSLRENMRRIQAMLPR